MTENVPHSAGSDRTWPCDDYEAPLTCYTVPKGPKHLTCGGCREAFPRGPEVQRLYRPVAEKAEVQAWRDAADKVDTGPTFPLLPSIISALLREHADALEAQYAVRETTVTSPGQEGSNG